jgi:hypothetical protein
VLCLFVGRILFLYLHYISSVQVKILKKGSPSMLAKH